MKRFLLLLIPAAIFLAAGAATAAMRVDILGPGQNMVNLALAAPMAGPQRPATGMGAELHRLVTDNLNFLPFMRLTDPRAVLGGALPPGHEPPALDLRRFQLAGSDIVVTALWPRGDSGTASVQIRAFETHSGGRIFGKEYPRVSARDLPEVADRFCADLLEVLTGSGAFFRSTLAFVRTSGRMKSDIWLCKPTGRDLRQITRVEGKIMSPSWSQDGRYIVFSHMDQRSHSLGIWDARGNRTQRVRFVNSVVIGPSFTPDNKVAVALSNGKYPSIFLLNHSFQKERVLVGGASINVSPSFDQTGTKMAFTSSRFGGPQIFMSEGGGVRRVSMNGGYNTEACISPDGTLVTFSRMTEYGHRIFVQDLVTGVERQISFGPGSDEQPSFCGDSYFIAFSSSRGGERGIYLTTRHGGDAKRVPTGGNASFPRWGMPGGR